MENDFRETENPALILLKENSNFLNLVLVNENCSYIHPGKWSDKQISF